MQKPVSVSIICRHGRACMVSAVGILAFGLAAPALAQTYTWVPTTGGTYTWSTPANWNPNTAFPNGDGVRANLIADFVPGTSSADPRGDFTVNLTANTTLNSLYFEDTGVDPDARLIIGGSSYTLTFAGTTPIISSNSSQGGGYGLSIAPTGDVGTVGVTKQGGGVVRFNNAITGSGNITVSSGTLEISGNSPAFTGQFIINSGGTLEARSFGDTSINVLGNTAAATVLNGTGRFMFRDVTGRTSAEPFIVNGIHASGSIRMYAASNVTITGPITLNNDVSFSQADWQDVQNNVIPAGAKKDFFINSVISQGTGGPYSAYFLGDYASTSAQGVNSRTGEMILGAQSTYGGNTYVTTNKANDASGSFSGNLRLSISNALPTTTTLVLGGAHSVKVGETGVGTLGTGAGNGKFALGGYNQTLAGLLASGTGTENRVVGNSATLSTLTLNIASDTTNTYAGYLGWTDTNDNNLALVKQGAGTLVLGAANTYAGGTTVSAGVLRPTNAGALGSGSITVSSGGQLQLDAAGTYTISNAITIAGNGVPGSDGAITSKAGGVDVTLAGAITLTGSADIKTRGTSTTRVTIAGGVDGSDGNRNLYLFGDNGGRVVVRDNPINLGTGILGGGFDLNVAGNTAGRLVAQWNQTVNLGASNPFTTPPVLELGNNSGTNGYLGKLNLNGHAFTASGLVELNTNTPGTSEVTDSVGGGTFTLNNASGATSTFAGKITGGLSLVKQGDGALVLTGANTYTGTTTVSGGTLRITNSGALGSTAAGTTVANFASLEVHGGISVAEPITITGGGYPQAQSWHGALRSTGG
ncbi:MAG: autotransporter-associated beta strand repeat-containing protein, partial [Patescibacteria group bacterium]|nr:autotransporter-associated beta strand repeat-containing protein [Patescibacteria group bacterium]